MAQAGGGDEGQLVRVMQFDDEPRVRIQYESSHTHTRWAAAGSQRSSRWRDCSLDAPAIVLGNQLLRSIYLKTGTAHIYSITSHCLQCNAVRIFRPCITLNHKYNIHPSKLISLTD